MQTNKSKTETNQLPTQVAADQNQSTNQSRSRGLREEINRTSIEWPQDGAPDPALFKIRVVRAKLFHLNGQVSQIIWHMPDYTGFIAFHHEAVDTMNEFIAYIASQWIGVEKYHTEFGTLKADGRFKPCPAPYLPATETIIQRGAKFIPGTKGKWITPDNLQSQDRTAHDGCHCATDDDFCADGCINTKKGGLSC
jgi:hypothetical protein